MTGSHQVEFNHDDADLVEEITERWVGVCSRHGRELDPLLTQMDIKAANGMNGNPALDLVQLMEFDDFNFAHDMLGIEQHMNRENGKVEGFFLPRCAVPASSEDDENDLLEVLHRQH